MFADILLLHFLVSKLLDSEKEEEDSEYWIQKRRRPCLGCARDSIVKS